MGIVLALLEAGIEPPERLIGVSVGALNAATLASFPSLAGAHMLREVWHSRLAREVFRARPLGWLLGRLGGRSLSALPASNVARLLERSMQLTGIDNFERLRVPLEVLATDIGTGRAHVFCRGPLLPPLLASTAIPGVFPPVEIDGVHYLDGGIVDNLPISRAVEVGAREILAVEAMAGPQLDRMPASWGELMSRSVQLTLHHRTLSEYERLKDRARIVVVCPLLPPGEGMDLRRERIDAIIDGARVGMRRLLESAGRRLFSRSGVHYVEVG